ncbi:MAG: 1-phosphofructokinase [Anaerolineae bacterium]|nr:1-phosphofructokinase [Anaerolineae bacterium]MDW8070472.1 1-phosphofructokinase [Anaerolineae bacterium]
MPSITTVTLNPVLDKAFSVPRLEPGTVHRLRPMREDLGGKGINVSRTLRMLGIPSRIVAFFGGRTGQYMEQQLRAAGYEVISIAVEGETRQNITLLDEARDQYTKFNEPGPRVGEDSIAALQACIRQSVQLGDIWAFCGSLPPGAPDDLYAQCIAWVQASGGRAFLDTSGAALRAGLEARPFAVKPNSEEASELLALALSGDAEHAAAARQLQQHGIALVAISRGARGIVLAMQDQVWMAIPPPVHARSPVGAGDAALAGLIWAVCDACEPAEVAARAVACGTAAAMQEGTGVGDRPLVETLLQQVTVTRLRP